MSLKRRARKAVKSAGGQVQRTAKQVGGQVQRTAKQVGRISAPYKAAAAPYVTGIGAGVGSFVVTIFAGPALGAVAGTALTAAGGAAGYYYGSTAARGEGKHGREARHEGRTVRRHTVQAGLIGTAVGTLGATAYTYATAPAAGSASALDAAYAAGTYGPQLAEAGAAAGGGLTLGTVLTGLGTVGTIAANYYGAQGGGDQAQAPVDYSGGYYGPQLPPGAPEAGGSDVPGAAGGGDLAEQRRRAAEGMGPGVGKGWLVGAAVLAGVLLMKAA